MPLTKATLARLGSQHELLWFLTASLTPEQIGFRLNPGKWSIQENIAHLACYQPRFIERIQSILSTTGPVFERYIAENDPAFEQYRQLAPPELLQRLTETRQSIIDLITSLPDEQLLRTGYHPKHGQMDIHWWTEFFLLHEAHHLFTIFNLARQLRSHD